jgi:glycosyltransferase involved in cell wall biosynthesis
MHHFAIDFNLNKEWIGGSYYVRNLISALGTLPADQQPLVTLLSNNKESVEFGLETAYPRLQWIKASDFYAKAEDFPFDAIFPWSTPEQAYRTISWIPDFQELHLPYYFSDQEMANRRHHHRLRFAAAGLVVSSQDVCDDVERFYSGECPNVAVVHFASFDKWSERPLSSLMDKYGLTGRYVMCANQVWIHKNHLVILKALSVLKSKGIKETVVFTGNESDYRVRGFSSFLREKAAQWGVAENVKFLGFIPRDEQLGLMKGASYIVQPSLFEGWSTTIEDAKSMNQFVVASDLAVHKEQLTANCRFFPRHNPAALAAIMQGFFISPPKCEKPLNYAENRQAFGRGFIAAAERFLRAKPIRSRKFTEEEVAAMSAKNMAEIA